MMRGNSFANGQALGNGPYATADAQGWDIRPLHTHWDGVEGRLPR